MCSRLRNGHVERNNIVCRCLLRDPQSPVRGAPRRVVVLVRPQVGSEENIAPGRPHRQSRHPIHQPHRSPHCLQLEYFAPLMGRTEQAMCG